MTDLSKDELREQYGRVLEEYRFQVTLNAARTRHLLTLDLGLLTASTGLLSLTSVEPSWVLVLPPLAGVTVSTLGWVLLGAQHGYYRRIRDLKGQLEQALGLGDYAIRTTAGMRGESDRTSRLARVGDVHRTVFVLLGILNLAIAGAAAAV